MADRILIVDDDDLLRESVVIAMRDAGFRTFDTGDGHRALALARAERPHLVVLDVMMPGLDGFAVLNVLRMEPLIRSTPVIMLTSLRQETEVRRAIDLGATAYVAKPIDPRALAARVTTVLNAQRQLASRPAAVVEWLD